MKLLGAPCSNGDCVKSIEDKKIYVVKNKSTIWWNIEVVNVFLSHCFENYTKCISPFFETKLYIYF